MADLKLIALEADDLTVISAHLQDAVLRIADLAWLPGDKRFALVANRFQWDRAAGALNRNARSRAALRFEHAQSAQVQGLDLTSSDTVLSLLTIQFEETNAPGGIITLLFAGDGAIRLNVECIEAELRDLGDSWKTKSRPKHSIVDAPDDTSADDATETGDASFNTDT